VGVQSEPTGERPLLKGECSDRGGEKKPGGSHKDVTKKGTNILRGESDYALFGRSTARIPHNEEEGGEVRRERDPTSSCQKGDVDEREIQWACAEKKDGPRKDNLP